MTRAFFGLHVAWVCLRVSGVGTHFLAISAGVLLMALMGMFNVHRHGSINTAGILLYALTSCEYCVSGVQAECMCLKDSCAKLLGIAAV